MVYWAAQIRFHSNNSPQSPYISKCFSSFTLFFRACLTLSSGLSSTSVLYPPNFSAHFSADSTSSWSPPKSFHYFLDYVIPSYSSSPFCFVLPYSPINYGWQTLFWHTWYSLLYTRFPSGKFVGEWRKDTILSLLSDAMTIYCTHTKKTCPEKVTFTLNRYFLGVLNKSSSSFYTFWVLDRRAHDGDLLHSC